MQKDVIEQKVAHLFKEYFWKTKKYIDNGRNFCLLVKIRGSLFSFLQENGEMNVTQVTCMANHCLYPMGRNVTEYIIQLLELSHSW